MFECRDNKVRIEYEDGKMEIYDNVSKLSEFSNFLVVHELHVKYLISLNTINKIKIEPMNKGE